MNKKNKKSIEALQKAKKAVEQANDALMSAIKELDDSELDKVAGGGEFDDNPGIIEHPYDPKDDGRY